VRERRLPGTETIWRNAMNSTAAAPAMKNCRNENLHNRRAADKIAIQERLHGNAVSGNEWPNEGMNQPEGYLQNRDQRSRENRIATGSR